MCFYGRFDRCVKKSQWEIGVQSMILGPLRNRDGNWTLQLGRRFSAPQTFCITMNPETISQMVSLPLPICVIAFAR